MATITSTGLGSGLDINGLVTKLVSAERTPTQTRLTNREADIQTKISSLGNFKSALASFHSSLSGLSSFRSFQKHTATSSDTASLTASADTNADVANYSVQINQLAQSHTLVSGRFASTDTVVGTGTLTIKFGATDYSDPDAGGPLTGTYNGFQENSDKGALTLHIDSGNNTLEDVRNAINQANAGITATLINDGGGYRLVLTSNDSGSQNSMQISVQDDDYDADTNPTGNTDISGLSVLAFNGDAINMQQTQAGQDAQITLNGVNITSSTNRIQSAVKGLTLNLLQAQPGKLLNVSVTPNDEDILSAVQGMVTGYNQLFTTVNSIAGYDAQANTAGVLMSDPVVRGGMSQIRVQMTTLVTGLSGGIQSLADIGITTQKDGTLNLDNGKLSLALNTHRSSVMALFSVSGQPSDGNITYLSSLKETQAGNYAINITQPATQGYLNGGTVNSLIIGSDNDTFSIRVNGIQSGSISLTQKDYSSNPDSLAAEIQTRINNDNALNVAGVGVMVSYENDANRFVIRSKSYGSSSQVAITDADMNIGSTIGLQIAASNDSGVNTGGKDIAGTIGGVAASGSGQILTGETGGAQGLKLFVGDSKTGSRGNVVFSRGVVERLNNVLDGLLETNGGIGSRSNGLNQELQLINQRAKDLNKRMDQLQARLFAQFNAMDALLGSMQATSSALTQTLSTLPYGSNGNSKN